MGVLVAAGLTVAAAGCTGGSPIVGDRGQYTSAAAAVVSTQGADVRAPVISDESAAPAALRFAGGEVRVAARVTDDRAVGMVWADVIGAFSTEKVPMAAGEGGTYVGTWTAPVNPSESGAAALYTIRVGARDGAGNTATGQPLTVTVRAIPVPPDGPAF